MTYRQGARQLSAHPDLGGLVELTNLEEVLRYLCAGGFDLIRMESVAHDEFTHDLCVPFPDGQRHLVIGVT